MTHITRTLVVLICMTVTLANMPAMLFAQEVEQSPEQILAERYVPVAYVRYQEQQCGVPPYEGEPYLPLPVEIIIDNDRVLVRDAENNDEVIAMGPSAQELATYGPTTYLDFPGDPRRPGCTYETDERLRIEEANLLPTTYANFIFDEENGKLALQYWFYWYFNDWNNTHESDWEGIQLVWDDVESIEAALETHPTRVGYSQHGNGEIANWGDSKLKLEDETHPLVFPAAGSHATFFSNDTFLAWGERNSGFGCDVSSPPSERVPLEVIVIPDEIDPEGEFAWLLYEGRWGERQPSAFNGPRGPMFNNRWEEPFETFETWRPFSIVVPDSRALGPSMSEAFCTLTAAGSSLLLEAIVRPWVLIPSVVGISAIFLYFAKGAMPIFRRARSMYASHWKLFFGIGLLSLPIGIIFNGLQQYFVVRNPLKFVVQYLDNSGGAYLTSVMAIGGIQQLAMLLIITPALVYAVREVRDGNTISVKEAYTGNIGRVGAIVGGFIIFLVTIGLLLITAIGVPVAIWLAVKWHFFVQVLIFDREASPIEALRKSFHVVRGSWWRTLFSLIVFDLLAVIPGIIVGFGLLTIGRTAVGFANGISSLLYAVLMPLSVIAVTLLFVDRREQVQEEQAESTEAHSVIDPVIAPGNT